MRLRRLTELLAIVPFALVAPAQAELPKDKDRWFRVETENFTLLSNASENATKRVGKNLERLREVLTKTTRGLRFNSPYPSYIYVFRNRSSFASYNIGHDGQPAREIAGYFVPSRDGNYVAVDATAGEHPMSVIYHEYLHYFLRNNVPAIPVWLNEGLAEFYSTFSVRGTRAEIGRIVENHLHWLDANQPITLTSLFRVDHASPEYNESDRRGTFYAQSWALTHFLLAGDQERRDRFNQLFRLIAAGAASEEALRQAYGLELDALEGQFRQYLDQRQYPYIFVELDQLLDLGQVAVTPVGRAEALVRLADLVVHRVPIQVKDARAHVEAALEIEPKYAEAHVVLGRLAERQGDLEQAAVEYQRAAEIDPENPVAWSHLGRVTQRRYLEAPRGASASRSAPLLLDARAHLSRSLALAPDDAETLAAFGSTFLLETEDLEPGIAALAEASTALPSRDDILFDLVVLHARAGNRSAAHNLVDGVLVHRAERDLLLQARRFLAEVDIQAASTLRREGQGEQAEALLREAAEQTDDPSIRSMLLSEVNAGKPTTVDPAVVAVFNEGVAAANSGDYERAVELMEQAIASSDDVVFDERAQAQLDGIRSMLHQTEVIQRFNEAIELANTGQLAEAVEKLEQILVSDPPAEVRTNIERVLPQMKRRLPPPEQEKKKSGKG
jgi:tetratricopeptide (TPR) repeat protein